MSIEFFFIFDIVFSLKLTRIIGMVPMEIAIVENRYKIQCQNSWKWESPDNRPCETTPNWITCNDEWASNSSNWSEHHRNKSFLGSFYNRILKTLSFGNKLINIIKKNECIPNNDTTKSNNTDHRCSSEVYSRSHIKNWESRKNTKEWKEECHHNKSANDEAPKLGNYNKIDNIARPRSRNVSIVSFHSPHHSRIYSFPSLRFKKVIL